MSDASGRNIASVVCVVEKVGDVDAVVIVESAKTGRSASAVRHGIMSIMLAVQRRARAQQRGTSVTQPSEGAKGR